MDNKINVGHKIILALNELCNETFSISDDTTLEQLISYIESDVSVLDICSLKDVEEWLIKVVSAWNTSELTPQAKHFSIRFFGLLGSSPKGFSLLKKNVLDHILMLTSFKTTDYESRFVTSLIDCIGMFSKHRDGWEWIVETCVWKFAITSFQCNKSIYINRAAKKLISLLISFDLENDKKCCLDLFRAVCDPLIELNALSIDTLLIEEECFIEKDQVKDKELSSTSRSSTTSKRKNNDDNDGIRNMNHLIRATKLLSEILEDIIVKNETIPFKLNFYKGCFLESCSQSSPEILLSISNLAFLIELCYQMTAIDHSIPPVASSDRGLHKDSCLYSEVEKHLSWTVEKMCKMESYNFLLQHLIYTLIWYKRVITWCQSLHVACTCNSFEDIIVACLRCYLKLSFYPQSSIIFQLPKLRPVRSIYSSDPISKRFRNRLINSKVLSSDDPRLQDLHYLKLGLPAVIRILALISSINKSNIEQDILIALCSIFTFRENDRWSIIEVNVVLDLLSLANNIFADYCPVDIGLKCFADSALLLFNLIMRNAPIWTDCPDIRMILGILQVIGTLLMRVYLPFICAENRVFESDKISQLKKLLISLLAHKTWEVRDSTLEVMQSLIDVVCLVPFSQQSEEDALITEAILKLVTDKAADEVRASALKYFSTAVRGKYFVTSVYPHTLFDISVKVLSEDKMPSVRRAACDLITALYINYVPAVLDVEEKLYNVLFEVSEKDMDWEVKKACLGFWQCCINKLLMSKIPASFLSPYKNRTEVGEIKEVLTKLGEVGCLKAVWIALNDDSDLSVSQEAKDVILNLEKLCNEWNLSKMIYDDDKCGNTKDTSKQLAPKDFFKLLNDSDWKQSLTSRAQWIGNDCDGLNSILDLILTKDNNMSDFDYNAVDCY